MIALAETERQGEGGYFALAVSRSRYCTIRRQVLGRLAQSWSEQRQRRPGGGGSGGRLGSGVRAMGWEAKSRRKEGWMGGS